MEGIVPLCRSLDHVGPIARTVEDAALVYAAMRGEKLAPRKIAGKRGTVRVGWPREYFFERLAPEVARAMEEARQLLRTRGVEFVDLALPYLKAANQASLALALAEAYHYHREAGYFPARASEYSEDVRKRLESGAGITAADYLDAQAARRRSTEEFRECGERVDALLVPTVPIVAPRIGETTITLAGVQEEVRGVLLRLCRPANLWGAPAISIPCGATPGGLPIGMQWIGFEGRETTLLWLAQLFEAATEWHRRRPRL
jgi:aspartyl-tRNA(Asn)/glutamyl-tRNA(Gln) amidotransferase subunit A